MPVLTCSTLLRRLLPCVPARATQLRRANHRPHAFAALTTFDTLLCAADAKAHDRGVVQPARRAQGTWHVVQGASVAQAQRARQDGAAALLLGSVRVRDAVPSGMAYRACVALGACEARKASEAQ